MSVKKIPYGKVATYGQIAVMSGSPRAARQLGYILRTSDTKLPWHRVINKTGRISISHPHLTADLQANLLKREGVKVDKRAGSFWVDLKQYLWRP